MIALALSLALAGQDADEFAAAVKKSQELKSYRFKMTFEVEGGPNAQGPTELSGWYDAEKGLYLKSNTGEVVKKGPKIVIASTGEEWMTLDAWQKEHKEPGAQVGAAIVKGFKPPHEGLRRADKRVETLEKASDKDKVGEEECAVYSGPFNEDAAEATFMFKNMLGFVEDRKLSAKLKVWVDGDKRPRKWILKHEVTGTAGGNDVNLSVTWTVELEKPDAAEAEVPEGAAKALGE
jgi:hypothetical protein